MWWSRRQLFYHSASALCTCVSLSDRCESCCLSSIPTMSKAIAKTKHKGDSSLRFRLFPSLSSLHYERGYTQAVRAWPAWVRSMRSQLSREPTAHIVSGFRYARFAPGRLSALIGVRSSIWRREWRRASPYLLPHPPDQSPSLWDRKPVLRVSIQDICNAARWSKPLTFVRFYGLNMQATPGSSVPYQSVTLDVTSEDRRIGISLRETYPLRV